MEWRDDGIILAVRGHGETSAIAEVFTAEHGRTLGLIRGGRSRQMRPMLQPGNRVHVTWRARLEEHLGHLAVEPVSLRAGFIIENALRLSGLASLTALAEKARASLGDARLGRTGSDLRPIGTVENPQPLTRFDPEHPYLIAEYDLGDRG